MPARVETEGKCILVITRNKGEGELSMSTEEVDEDEDKGEESGNGVDMQAGVHRGMCDLDAGAQEDKISRNESCSDLVKIDAVQSGSHWLPSRAASIKS